MQLEQLSTKIYEIRGQRVMLDYELAEIYETETRLLKRAVRRNMDRFPEDFMFQLTKIECTEVIPNWDNLPERFSPIPPFAFSEQGVAMLSSVLKSKKAIQTNVNIMRAFVLLRQFALSHAELSEKLRQLEEKFHQKFNNVNTVIDFLLKKDKQQTEQQNRKRIGYK